MRERLYEGVQGVFWRTKLTEILKENLEKKKTAVFRKRFSAKTAVFFGL